MDRRQVGFALGAGAVVLLVCAVLVEVVLRVYAGAAETSLAGALRVDPYAVLVEPHGEAGYRPRPGRTFEYPNGTAAHANEMGFRGPTVGVPKPTEVFRVVLLGGSTTFGWGVDDAHTIDAHMRRLFSERFPGSRVEVVNLALDGYDSYQLLERLRTDGLPLDPDVVILNTGVNDVRNAWFRDIRDGDRRTLLYLATMDQARYERARGGPTAWTRAKHYLYLARVPGWVRGQLSATSARSTVAEQGLPEYHWDAVDYFERNVRRSIELATETLDGVAILLSTPPSSLRTKYAPNDPPNANYWIRDAETTQVYRDSLSARLRQVAEVEAASGREVAYVRHAEIPPELFLDDAHLTSEGNLRVAEDFVAAVEPFLRARMSAQVR